MNPIDRAIRFLSKRGPRWLPWVILVVFIGLLLWRVLHYALENLV